MLYGMGHGSTYQTTKGQDNQMKPSTDPKDKGKRRVRFAPEESTEVHWIEETDEDEISQAKNKQKASFVEFNEEAQKKLDALQQYEWDDEPSHWMEQMSLVLPTDGKEAASIWKAAQENNSRILAGMATMEQMIVQTEAFCKNAIKQLID
jgi:hypothetical protein